MADKFDQPKSLPGVKEKGITVVFMIENLKAWS